MKLRGFICAILLLIPVSLAAETPPSFQSHPIVVEKELLITDLAVVDSEYANYPGPLSFGHLVEQLAEPGKSKEFVLSWLESWEDEQTVNEQPVAARKAIRERIIEPWKNKDGYLGSPREAWAMNLANAPFRLLAIVNRIDLGPFISVGSRQVGFGSALFNSPNSGYSGGSSNLRLPSTGEARFVFGVTDAEGAPLEGGFTVIFEYRLPEMPSRANDLPSPNKVRDRLPPGFGAFDDVGPGPSQAERTLPARLAAARYAARWHELGSHAAFDESYLCDLLALTSEITDRVGTRSPFLGQLRTNEGALAAVQEAREYGYKAQKLTIRPVANTPALVFNSDDSHYGRAISRFIDRNQRDILENDHSVPKTFESGGERFAFQAGSALMPKTGDRPADAFRWDAPNVRYGEALRRFSLNTCNGCHCGETNTTFYHIAPRRAGEESALSDFLSPSKTVEVRRLGPREGTVEINELAQRAAVFEAILNPGYDERTIKKLIRERAKRTH